MKAESYMSTALKLYAEALRLYFIQELKRVHGSGRGWVEAYLGSLSESRRAQALED